MTGTTSIESRPRLTKDASGSIVSILAPCARKYATTIDETTLDTASSVRGGGAEASMVVTVVVVGLGRTRGGWTRSDSQSVSN